MKNAIAFITGGTGGIGTAIGQMLSKEGINVAVGYHNEAKSQKWLQQQEAQRHTFLRVHSKVEDFDACAKTVAAVEELGPIDVLVNNAGITRDTQFKNMSYEQWQQVLRINLDSVFNITRQVINSMISRNYGRIINISS